mgnify:CR=1 FL=1
MARLTMHEKILGEETAMAFSTAATVCVRLAVLVMALEFFVTSYLSLRHDGTGCKLKF